MTFVFRLVLDVSETPRHLNLKMIFFIAKMDSTCCFRDELMEALNDLDLGSGNQVR